MSLRTIFPARRFGLFPIVTAAAPAWRYPAGVILTYAGFHAPPIVSAEK